MWTGQLLRINLTTSKTSIESLDPRLLRQVVGGKGLGAYILNKELDPTIDPTSPSNKIILATGPAQGSLPIAGRYCVVTKSPHSGIFLDSHVGGYLGPEMKFAGYDAIIVEGRAPNFSYIQINNGETEILDGQKLRGLDVIQTTDTIVDEFDKKARVIAIGPAGENLVPIAATNSDYYRTAARGGVGMLFGTKNLKAIAIRGTNKIKEHDPDKVREVRREINRRAITSTKNGHMLPRIGTSWLVTIASGRDMLPTLNYQQGEWDQAEEISGESIEDTFGDKIKRKPCYRCSLACSYIIETDFEWARGKPIQHPEYESLALLGSNLGISDLSTLVHANHLCNIYGLDTISTGSTISWFIECGKKGKVPDKFHAEIIDFGDNDGVIELIRKIAYREGVGDVLALGVRKAAEIFGNGTNRWAVHVRGLELPAWDPRGKLGLGLSYITSNVGGSHLRGWPSTSNVPDRSALPVIDSMIEQQDLKILKDSLIMCHFTHSISPAMNINDAARFYEALTGVPSTVQSIRQIAQNIWIMCRQFNVKAWGSTTPRETDILPPRLMKDGLPSGIAKGKTSFVNNEDLDASLDYFYEQRNCETTGIPKNSELDKLRKLQLIA